MPGGGETLGPLEEKTYEKHRKHQPLVAMPGDPSSVPWRKKNMKNAKARSPRCIFSYAAKTWKHNPVAVRVAGVWVSLLYVPFVLKL